METTIVVAEPLRILRDGLYEILRQRPDLQVVAAVADGRTALDEILRRGPAIAILELVLPRLSGTEVIRRATSRAATRSIVLSTHNDRGHVHEAVRAGAAGYLHKDVSRQQLFDAIDAVRSDGFYFAPEVTGYLVAAASEPATPQIGSLASLTSREREVLQLVAEGLSTKEIAASLDISLRTVESHRARLMAKTGLRKAAGLVRIAIREGLVNP